MTEFTVSTIRVRTSDAIRKRVGQIETLLNDGDHIVVRIVPDMRLRPGGNDKLIGVAEIVKGLMREKHVPIYQYNRLIQITSEKPEGDDESSQRVRKYPKLCICLSRAAVAKTDTLRGAQDAGDSDEYAEFGFDLTNGEWDFQSE